MQSHDLSSSANEQDTMSDVFRQVQDLLIVLDEVGLKIVVKMGVTFQVPSYWSRHLDLRAMIRIQLFLVEFPRVSLFWTTVPFDR
jgi:hypothetical protein